MTAPERALIVPDRPMATAITASPDALIIGIDGGAKTGYGIVELSGARHESGVIDLAKHVPVNRVPAELRPGAKFAALNNAFRSMLSAIPREHIILVAHEQSSFGGSGASAMMGYGYATTIELVCDLLGIPCVQILASQVKKTATTFGVARKNEVVDAANTRWGLSLAGGNGSHEADALFVAEAARLRWLNR